MSNLEYLTAAEEMADAIHNILHTTIRTVYPKYYPKEVADFFCQLHSREHILEGIASGNMGVLIDRDRRDDRSVMDSKDVIDDGNVMDDRNGIDDRGVIVGTGCYDGNHITGVYVLPDYQKKGCGSRIMDCLEAAILKKYDTVLLDASLSAVCLYEHRGYQTVGHGIIELQNDVKLVYEIMEKKLKAD